MFGDGARHGSRGWGSSVVGVVGCCGRGRECYQYENLQGDGGAVRDGLSCGVSPCTTNSCRTAPRQIRFHARLFRSLEHVPSLSSQRKRERVKSAVVMQQVGIKGTRTLTQLSRGFPTPSLLQKISYSRLFMRHEIGGMRLRWGGEAIYAPQCAICPCSIAESK
jgi:hypothetical protein